MRVPTLDHLRRHALRRSLFAPTTLGRAIEKLGFVQADPIRAPARAQDLTLRHRVRDYRAGDLERRYPRLAIEEDFFVNYGFLPRRLHRLMHPRTARLAWPAARLHQAQEVLAFVRDQGVVHPRDVDRRFEHGKTRNWFGGSSNASTQLLDEMHYRGMLRVARRDGGTRCYAAHDDSLQTPCRDPIASFDALVDLAIAKYAPLPAPTLGWLLSALARNAAPQWQAGRAAALERVRQRVPTARVDGIDWYWPAGESPFRRVGRRGSSGLASATAPDGDRTADDPTGDDSDVDGDAGDDGEVRLLAPFDPVVWDRRRFELFWGWAYRFEAYTPAARRVRGYYALPMLWRDQVIGWGNLALSEGRLTLAPGYVAGQAPPDPAFHRGLEAEMARMRHFLGP